MHIRPVPRHLPEPLQTFVRSGARQTAYLKSLGVKSDKSILQLGKVSIIGIDQIPGGLSEFQLP